MEKRLKYTSFVQTKKEELFSEPSIPNHQVKVEAEPLPVSQIDNPNSLAYKHKQMLAQKVSQDAYAIFKYKFYTHKKGVHIYHGKLVDIQTSRHQDKNQFRDILSEKPSVKCTIAPVMKDVQPSHRLAHTTQTLDMPKFAEGDIVVLSDPIIMHRQETTGASQVVVGTKVVKFEDSHLKLKN